MSKITSKERILTTARHLFFEHGFEHVTTDLLAREASVSKASIYRHFQNMLDILSQVTDAEAARFRSVLPQDVSTRAQLHMALTEFGNGLLNFLNQRETLAFNCLIHEEARNNPELGQTFYAAAIARILDDLGQNLSRAQASGVLKDTYDGVDIAEDFIALLQGFGLVRVQLRVAEEAFSDADARVQRAIETILAAHGMD